MRLFFLLTVVSTHFIFGGNNSSSDQHNQASKKTSDLAQEFKSEFLFNSARRSSNADFTKCYGRQVGLLRLLARK